MKIYIVALGNYKKLALKLFLKLFFFFSRIPYYILEKIARKTNSDPWKFTFSADCLESVFNVQTDIFIQYLTKYLEVLTPFPFATHEIELNYYDQTYVRVAPQIVE